MGRSYSTSNRRSSLPPTMQDIQEISDAREVAERRGQHPLVKVSIYFDLHHKISFREEFYVLYHSP